MTEVTLIVVCGETDSQQFDSFDGAIPRIGELVTYYKKIHDGCRWRGRVTKIEHRIEFKAQNAGGLKKSLQDVVVYLTEDNEAFS
jgi:hypothetical protein